ncbi:conserved hypothetical protein [Ricinus communis]|uniref:Uncharacterized protein n=1 Tax=Ricinus communis TaxID=3988 RepID=B9RIY9_RICCO|nr:conserved hypothetical protein [Ricinus communis]
MEVKYPGCPRICDCPTLCKAPRWTSWTKKIQEVDFIGVLITRMWDVDTLNGMMSH